MRTPIVRGAVLALSSIAFVTLGCAPQGDPGADIGSVGVALLAGPGITLDTFSYTITGPGAFSRTGSIDTSHSSTVSAVIGNLPAGTGFSISLAATSNDSQTTCSGSAPFAVMAHSTTSVTVHVACRQAPTTGSVLVTGSLNVCPSVDGISASPAEVVVGGTVALGGLAHDADGLP